MVFLHWDLSCSILKTPWIFIFFPILYLAVVGTINESRLKGIFSLVHWYLFAFMAISWCYFSCIWLKLKLLVLGFKYSNVNHYYWVLSLVKSSWWRDILLSTKFCFIEMTAFSTGLVLLITANIVLQDDGYIPKHSVMELQKAWPGSEVRWVTGGHVSSFLLHNGEFRRAIVDGLDRLPWKEPPLW